MRSPEYISGELTAGSSPASHQAAKPFRESKSDFRAKRSGDSTSTRDPTGALPPGPTQIQAAEDASDKHPVTPGNVGVIGFATSRRRFIALDSVVDNGA